MIPEAFYLVAAGGVAIAGLAGLGLGLAAGGRQARRELAAARASTAHLADQLHAAQAAAAKPAPYAIPGPYDIAMAFGPALAMSGRYETIGAAMAAAWFSVPEFYQARDEYLRDIAPLRFGLAQAARAAAGGGDPSLSPTEGGANDAA